MISGTVTSHAVISALACYSSFLTFVLVMQMPILPGMVDGLGSQLMQRRQLYAGPMSKLRQLMICRMAKPEEVLIVEDENGNIVRETMKDNDVLVQYKVIVISKTYTVDASSHYFI